MGAAGSRPPMLGQGRARPQVSLSSLLPVACPPLSLACCGVIRRLSRSPRSSLSFLEQRNTPARGRGGRVFHISELIGVVNNKCEVFIKMHRGTPRGGTRNHASFVAKSSKNAKNCHKFAVNS